MPGVALTETVGEIDGHGPLWAGQQQAARRVEVNAVGSGGSPRYHLAVNAPRLYEHEVRGVAGRDDLAANGRVAA